MSSRFCQAKIPNLALVGNLLWNIKQQLEWQAKSVNNASRYLLVARIIAALIIISHFVQGNPFPIGSLVRLIPGMPPSLPAVSARGRWRCIR